VEKAKRENEEIEKKTMATFQQRKEAALAGKKTPAKGKPSTSKPAPKSRKEAKVNGTNGVKAEIAAVETSSNGTGTATPAEEDQ
jgi:hypothetical protein